jgi:hypothetical protein
MLSSAAVIVSIMNQETNIPSQTRSLWHGIDLFGYSSQFDNWRNPHKDNHLTEIDIEQCRDKVQLRRIGVATGCIGLMACAALGGPAAIAIGVAGTVRIMHLMFESMHDINLNDDAPTLAVQREAVQFANYRQAEREHMSEERRWTETGGWAAPAHLRAA